MSIAGARCAVLGAGGFIGTNLCMGLAAAGASVVGFGRRSPWPIPTPWVEGEFGDEARVAEAVRGTDIVFHLLGGSVPAESNRDPVADVQGSLIPSVRLIEQCRALGVGRLIFASSGGTVYGVTGPDPVDEAHPTDPITAYGINKLAVEKYLALFRHLHGFDSLVLRIANPYGPYQHARRPQGVVGLMLARALAGETLEIWGDGSVVRDMIYVDDVVAGMIAAAVYQGRERVFNIGSGEGRTTRSIAEDVCAATGTSVLRIVHRPGRAADVPVNILSPARMAVEMGWRPCIGWREGVVDTVAWLRGQAI